MIPLQTNTYKCFQSKHLQVLLGKKVSTFCFENSESLSLWMKKTRIKSFQKNQRTSFHPVNQLFLGAIIKNSHIFKSQTLRGVLQISRVCVSSMARIHAKFSVEILVKKKVIDFSKEEVERVNLRHCTVLRSSD